jgi:ATP-dependent helicase YprA (DUF1998 family)
MWQQAGRAGRARQRSLAVLVAGDDQLDQWLMTHPAEVFRRSPEPAVINPSNHHVLLPHLACAPTSSRSPWPTSSGGGTTWTTACGPSSSPTG